MVMWLKLMRFVPSDGIPVRELQRLTRLTGKEMGTWLTRMGKWWGYVVVEPDTTDGPSNRLASGGVGRPSAGGRRALEIWRPLTGVIEKRWQERFGKEIIERLRESLQALVDKFDGDLPDYLPILGYELFSKGPDGEGRAPAGTGGTSLPEYTLPMLLSKVLLAFAIEFERDSRVSLAISANVLRLIGPEGARVRDLPRLSGVSKEAIAMCLGRLEERGFAIVQPESPASRVKILMLTLKGLHAHDAYQQSVSAIEERWQASFGKNTIRNLRSSLERMVGEPTARKSPLFSGLEPYPHGWRAAIPRPDVLPHYPMVLHRGGFPDGS